MRWDTRPAQRRACQRLIVDFPVHAYVAPTRHRPRRAPVRPADRPLIQELERRHQDFNDRFFDGTLNAIRFRVSHRMRRRLGEVLLDPTSERPVEIAISRTHIERDGWEELDHTLLHEMIHQWQAETGQTVDHGAAFRQKAGLVGIVPRATRHIRSSRRSSTNDS